MGGIAAAGTAGKGRWTVAASLLLALGLWGGAAAKEPPSLAEVELSDVLVAANSEGEVVTYQRAERLVTLWSPQGRVRLESSLDDERERGEAYLVALRGHRALLAFFEPLPGEEKQQLRRTVVVDLESRKVAAVFALPGLVLSAAGADGGWLVLRRMLGAEPSARPRSFAEAGLALEWISDDGGERKSLELPPGVAEGVREASLSSAAAFSGRPVGVGRHSWFVPTAHYELWRLKRGTRPARLVEPLPCLAAAGRMLGPEETRRRWEQIMARADAATRKRFEAMAAAEAGEGKVQYAPSFVGAVTAVAPFGTRLAVAVRDGSRSDGGCRLDVWDLDLEGVVAVAQLPEGVCPSFLALHEDGVWAWQGSHLARYSFELSALPLPEPCLAAGRAAATDARGVQGRRHGSEAPAAVALTRGAWLAPKPGGRTMVGRDRGGRTGRPGTALRCKSPVTRAPAQHSLEGPGRAGCGEDRSVRRPAPRAARRRISPSVRSFMPCCMQEQGEAGIHSVLSKGRNGP